MAEETGPDRGDRRLGRSARSARSRSRGRRAGLTPQISFNVSPRQLRRLDFARPRRRAPARDRRRPGAAHGRAHGVRDCRRTRADAEPILRELHELGLQLALDDFGAGLLVAVAPARDAGRRRSRSTAPSCARCPRAPRRRRSSPRSSTSRARSAAPRSPRASRPRRSRASWPAEDCPLAQGFLLARPMPAGGRRERLRADGERRRPSCLAPRRGARLARDGAERAAGDAAPRGRRSRRRSTSSSATAACSPPGPGGATVELRAADVQPAAAGRRARRAERAGACAPGVDVRGDGAAEAWTGRRPAAGGRAARAARRPTRAARGCWLRARASSRSAAASAACARQSGTRDSSSAQKRGEWSMTSRWQTSCSTT